MIMLPFRQVLPHLISCFGIADVTSIPAAVEAVRARRVEDLRVGCPCLKSPTQVAKLGFF